MPIAAIIGGVEAAAHIFGAKKNSDAAKDAAKIQTQAVDKAQAFNERAYNDQKTAIQPYVDFGKSSLASLQQRYGGGQPLVNRFAPTGMTTQGQPSFMPAANGPALSPMSLAGMQQMQAAGPPAGGAPQAFGPPPMGGGGTVKLQAPDGEIRDVPMHLADQLMARGARRVA